MSLALYRKYRSLTFADLIGQSHIADTLRNQVRRGEVAHAYLFAGIRGTGKTSSARILARAVTCLAPVDGEPDNTCSACVEVLSGAAVDVLEIDGASNRGIDEMRDLREKVKFLPAVLRRKVYIVDEAHMLTEPAWNAFLKTLEEPPPHVLFILATTEPHKVPETVRSRVQRFDFRRVPTADIALHLAAVCALEGASADGDALELVAEAGQGSVRDALSVLDQALATGERPLHESTVRRALGLADPATLRALMLGIANGDAAAALRGAAVAFDAGADARQLLREMSRLARGAELFALGYPQGAELTGEDAAVCAELAEVGRRGLWVDAIDRFAGAEINLRQPVDSRLQVELALLRLAEGAKGFEERLARLEEAVGSRGGGVTPAPGSVPPAMPVPPVSPLPRLPVPPAPGGGGRPGGGGPGASSVVGGASRVTSAPSAEPESLPAPSPPPPAALVADDVAADPPSTSSLESGAPSPSPAADRDGPIDLEGWVGAWPLVIEAVNRRDPMLAGVLRSCRPVDGGPGRLVVGAPYGFHLERLQDRQKAPLLADAVVAVAGRPCNVESIFSGDQPTPGGVRASTGAGGPGASGGEAGSAARSDSGDGGAAATSGDAEADADATSALLAAFPGARLTGSVLRDSRGDPAP